MTTQPAFHPRTRILHNLVALLITTQLFIGALMQPPRPGQPHSTLFEVHATLGLASLASVAAFILWIALRRVDTPVAQLFPWFGEARARAMGQFAALLRGLWRRRLPEPEATAEFASAIHGLGLLAALGMGASGGLYWVLTEILGDTSSLPHQVGEFHSTLVSLMWAYLGGHVFMALLHQWLGHGTLWRILGKP